MQYISRSKTVILTIEKHIFVTDLISTVLICFLKFETENITLFMIFNKYN